MVEQLLLHATGDYLTQNDWMAQNKTKSSLKGYLACLIHAIAYSLPFLLIGSFAAWIVIFVSHFFIDKYRLATYWIKLVNWNWKSKNFGFDNEKPTWMSVWLMIIIDNVFHLICNYFSLKYL